MTRRYKIDVCGKSDTESKDNRRSPSSQDQPLHFPFNADRLEEVDLHLPDPGLLLEFEGSRREQHLNF